MSEIENVIIIGSGPAGYTAALYASRADLRPLVIEGFLWGGLVRVFLLHHMTWSINSICHFVGRRRFATTDQSTNVFWLALPSFGEAWHHNHHAFPRSAFHGLRRVEIDPGGLVIWALERCGLAWDVIRIPPSRQQHKLTAST